MKEWAQRHWKILAAVGAGVLGLYLLSRKGGGGGAAPAAADTGSPPATGPPPIGNQTPQAPQPQPAYFSPEQQAAAGYAGQMGQLQKAAQNAIQDFSTPQVVGTDKGGHTEYSYGTGAVSKAWQQVAQGTWEDIFHPGHIITEQQAQQLSSQNSGPYARGGGGFFVQLGSFLGTALTSIGQTALRTYAGAHGVPLPAQGGSSAPPASFTPPFVSGSIGQQSGPPQPTTPSGVPDYSHSVLTEVI